MSETEWVLVPRVPTEAMEAARRMYGDTSDWWNAMLASAPQPPSGGEVVAFVDALQQLLVDHDDGKVTPAGFVQAAWALVNNFTEGGTKFRTAPPNAPVGVVEALVELVAKRRTEADKYADATSGWAMGWHDACHGYSNNIESILAQQPAAAGVSVDVVREYLDARACYEDATRKPNSHAPAPTLKHGDPVVLRLREARIALDAVIEKAKQPAAEPRSTHRAWRYIGEDFHWLPCCCASTKDHAFGHEQAFGPEQPVGVKGLPASEVNTLPEHVRKYIMWLETDADPAGTVRDNFRLTEENAALRIMITEQQPAAVDELPDCPHSALDGCDCYAAQPGGSDNE